MISPAQGARRWRRVVIASGFAIGALASGTTRADEPTTTCRLCLERREDHRAHASGVLPGHREDFQGFGLGYHLGHGYGGRGLGVGPDGGYPFYSGPGYPHPAPFLRRFGGTEPFPFYGGPGGPTAHGRHFFGPVGPLVADPPVIVVADDPGQGDYGPFGGALPYPESAFSSATAGASADAEKQRGAAPDPSLPGASLDDHEAGRSLGLVVDSHADPSGERGLRVTGVTREGEAHRAGLRDGDVIRSVNGYITESPTDLARIAARTGTDRILKLTVSTPDGKHVRVITTRLP